MGGVKLRKQLKRLGRRVKAFEEHGPEPRGRLNPGKGEGSAIHILHKPGSRNK